MVGAKEPADAEGARPQARGADQPFVRVEGLGRDYGGVTAVESFDLEVTTGEAVALVGQNGSGKTTVLSTIAGRLEPTRGSAEVAGIDVHRNPGSTRLRALMSFVPDTPALYSDLTVTDHLQLVGLANGVEDLDQRIESLLERFGLAERRHLMPRELSRGMRQKTELACALLRPFGVLMLDEPMSGLDPPSRKTLQVLLGEAKRDGAVVMLSTHHLDLAKDLVDRIVVLENGRVAAEGTYDEVVTHDRAGDWGLA